MQRRYESLTYIRNLATPTTSPISPVNLDFWLCIMGSQITVCPPPQLRIPVVRVWHWESSFVFLTHWKHRANSAARLAPCRPPGPPLALFMKARPLSAALSGPLPLWCRLPTSWVHFICSFLLPFPLCSSLHPPHQGVLAPPVLRPPSPAHWKCASILMNETAAREIKTTHPFSIFTLFILSSFPLTVSDPHPLSCCPSFYLAPSQCNKLSVTSGSAQEGAFHVP